MEIKPSITKSLNDRRTVLGVKATDLRSRLVGLEADRNTIQKELAEAEAEIADIDEFLSAPTEDKSAKA